MWGKDRWKFSLTIRVQNWRSWVWVPTPDRVHVSKHKNTWYYLISGHCKGNASKQQGILSPDLYRWGPRSQNWKQGPLQTDIDLSAILHAVPKLLLLLQGVRMNKLGLMSEKPWVRLHGLQPSPTQCGMAAARLQRKRLCTWCWKLYRGLWEASCPPPQTFT